MFRVRDLATWVFGWRSSTPLIPSVLPTVTTGSQDFPYTQTTGTQNMARTQTTGTQDLAGNSR